jgi:hypothetical protein
MTGVNWENATKIWESDTDDGFACLGAHTNYEVIVPRIQTFSEESQSHNEALKCKLFQFTKICKSPRLTVMFCGIKICVSSPMPILPYP